MKKLLYYYSKFFKIVVRGKSVINSHVNNKAVVSSGCSISNSVIGRYSYCGYDCDFINCKIGAFCSISDHVFIGGGEHPIHWVSTSPAFQEKKHGPRRLKRLSSHSLPPEKQTIIGNDVWIGHGATIKQGVIVGDGAVIGSCALVTKDVPPYAIVGGVPAKVIKYRFDDETIASLLKSEWWNFTDSKLSECSHMIQHPKDFLSFLQETSEV